MEEFDKDRIFLKVPKKHERQYEQLTLFDINKEAKAQQAEESEKDRKIKLYERFIEYILKTIMQNSARLMGRTPTLEEFTELVGISIQKLIYQSIFYSYNDLVRAAELEPNRDSPSSPPKNRF